MSLVPVALKAFIRLLHNWFVIDLINTVHARSFRQARLSWYRICLWSKLSWFWVHQSWVWGSKILCPFSQSQFLWLWLWLLFCWRDSLLFIWRNERRWGLIQCCPIWRWRLVCRSVFIETWCEWASCWLQTQFGSALLFSLFVKIVRACVDPGL